jgi:hypothetical protein
MTVDTEIRTLAAPELDEVSGGFWVGLMVGSTIQVAFALAYQNGAFDSVVQWKDGKPVGLGVPQ